METARHRRDVSLQELTHWASGLQHLPVLVATGQHDALVPGDRAAQVAQRFAHGQLVIIPGCGHLSHEEAPIELLDQLVPFCEHSSALGGSQGA